MANSTTKLTTTKDIATCGVFALTGPCKIVAKGMVEGDVVYIFEETGTADNTDGTYQQVPNTEKTKAALYPEMQSTVFEGYGNYKCLLGPDTNVDLIVSMAS